MRVGSLVTAVALTLVVGCSSSGNGDKGGKDAGSKLPLTGLVCADEATSHQVDLPKGFPADFPLPAGMIVTAGEDRGDAGLVVSGVTATSFKDVLKGLQDDLPANGYTPENGEVEPDDAESDWTSADFEGRWAIRENPQCEGDTAVSVLARPKA